MNSRIIVQQIVSNNPEHTALAREFHAMLYLTWSTTHIKQNKMKEKKQINKDKIVE